MPDIKNCKRCRKIIMHTAGPQLCDACKKADEEEFIKVRKFVRDFPGATVQEASTATEVSQNTIIKYLKEGRLEVAENSPLAILCETCGARVRSGRFCAKCTTSLAREMMNAGQTLHVDNKQGKEDDKRRSEERSGLRFKHRHETE